MNVDLLASDLRYKSLLAKVERLESIVAILEKERAKPRPKERRAFDMPKADGRFDAMAAICQPIADQHKISLDALRGRGAMNGYPARSVAMQACLDAGFSLVAVGKFFDGRCHSTVMDAVGLRGKRSRK